MNFNFALLKFVRNLIGASVSEPHTSELNRDFSYIITYFLAYVVPYILNAVIYRDSRGPLADVRFSYSLVSLTAS